MSSPEGETVLTMALAGESWRPLLHENPILASMPNQKGQLPLHLAGTVTWKDGLKDLFAACPRALTMQEPETRLYPFMLSQDVTTTFEMLRADPSVMLNSTIS